MRRRFRILPAALTALSLLLCLASVALWVRSYWLTHLWGHNAITITPTTATLHHRYAGVDAGAVFVGEWRNGTSQASEIAIVRADPASANFARPPGFFYISYPEQTAMMPWRPLVRFDFQSRVLPRPGGWVQSWRILSFPIWPLALAFATPSLVWLLRRRRRRCRIASNRCPACGYDLRATPDRCPECGAVPSSTARAEPET